MILGLLGAIAAAVCFGLGSVLQALAARRAPTGPAADPRLLVRLAGQLPFAAGLALDVAGFLAELGSLRTLPLFVVQAVVSAELAVTAIAAGPILKIRPTRREWTAVAAVCAGLCLLGLSAGREGPARTGTALHWALLAAALLMAAAGFALARLARGAAMTIALGLLGGLGFGIVALAARVVTDLWPPQELLTDPAAYALAIGGLAGFLFYATALQRGSVTSTVAALVVAQTAVPAALGIWLLGDHSRPGWEPAAVLGFAVALAATLTLARFGEPEPEPGTERPAGT
ncbi:hypothetical protein [Actinomadura parmotrematis]|uniref:DMT family transporter n=1 Tax=Actinomadura parmotrematis TaxID=2864039 RepID=A0ABS7FQS9_9ACTN|nr:hypothetical protein [Actinomadura parmotrematis]MBW8482763.1 hypothetical protein [Actinomadura parmotrematis]